MILDFLDMANNHEERKVARYEEEELIIDTCQVTDSDQPYETGISHPNYNNGDWIIVELYNTKEEAQEGHNKWVKTMTNKKLPNTLTDMSSSTISKLHRRINETTLNQYPKQ